MKRQYITPRKPDLSRISFAKLSLVLSVAMFLTSTSLLAQPKFIEQRSPSPGDALDVGDYYRTPKGPRHLHRVAGLISLEFETPEKGAAILNALRSPGNLLENYEIAPSLDGRFAYAHANSDELASHLRDPGRLTSVVADLRSAAGMATANPVFLDPESNLMLVPTEEIIIRLADPADLGAVSAQAAFVRVRPLPGTPDHFVVTTTAKRAEAMLTEVNRLAGDPRLRFAEPNFLMEGKRNAAPNDTRFSDQWHLNNTGQSGGISGADARAVTAWDRTTGSGSIVAVLDTGIQTAHPDLSGNLPGNTLEIAGNGLDDDGNGHVDDVNGWDFHAADADPNPSTSFDKHGTAVAGVAVAAGNNSLGVAGMAYSSRLLAVRIGEAIDDTGGFSTTAATIASGIYYAAGRNASGVGTWRGADVLNLSFGISSSATMDTALNWAATSGRAGNGCPVFCSTGNSASGWKKFTLFGIPAGSHTFRWAYVKNASGVAGSDAAWLDDVTFPGGTTERFEGAFPPAGWTRGGSANWTVFTENLDRVRGTGGTRSARTGIIGNNQNTYLEVTRTVVAGELTFWLWVSCAAGDRVRFLYDSVQFFGDQSGVPTVTTAVGYPASHADTIGVGASTDFDFRSDYSQFGTDLDFLASSGGGQGDIWTTDRTSTDGYNVTPGTDGDYMSTFSGTSSASPLAAGIGALMLARTPTLTAAQVRTRLREACAKVGGVTYDATGWESHYGFGRLDAHKAVAQGLADPGFSSSGTTTKSVDAIRIQTDGKIVIGGELTQVRGVAKNTVARLNSDGTVDTSFDAGTGADNGNGFVLGMVVQSDGKVVVGGSFTDFNGSAKNNLARLSSSGAVETSYNTAGLNDAVNAISLQADGKVVVGGYFTAFGADSRNRICRVTTAGANDTTFTPGTGADISVNAIAIQSDAKILIGGGFTTFNGTGRARIARLNSNGTLDTTFNPGTGANNLVSCIAIQPDGKILIGGYFTSYNGTTRNRIARLNSTGTLDTTFDPGTGAAGAVLTISLQSNGKLFMGGDFLTYNGTTVNRLARLQATGALDSLFDTGTGVTSAVTASAIQSNGRILIGGGFSYGGQSKIARLYGE